MTGSEPTLESSDSGQNGSQDVARGADELFREHQRQIYIQTDHLFAGLMVCQWLAAILAALLISPRAWAGTTSTIHIHLLAAVFLGAAISALPIYLAVKQPGKQVTRQVIAVAQMLYSALLIHLTGGRIETHFHVFGSLAFLGFYRDWKVVRPPTVAAGALYLLSRRLL